MTVRPVAVRAAIYGRNSKPPKGWRPSVPGEEPPGSWSIQLAAARRAAETEGCAVIIEEHDVATGANPNRPGWQKVFNGVKGGSVQRVYVTRIDRIIRSLSHFLEIAEVFDKRGVDAP